HARRCNPAQLSSSRSIGTPTLPRARGWADRLHARRRHRIGCALPSSVDPGAGRLRGPRGLLLALPPRASELRGKDVVLVGGGNSAGQGAVFLSGHAARVLLLIRGSNLSQSMSRYLVDRIAATSNIHVHPFTELTALRGNERGELERVRWKNKQTGVENEANVRHVFLFVGADPATEWLP